MVLKFIKFKLVIFKKHEMQLNIELSIRSILFPFVTSQVGPPEKDIHI
jgi:hypothetical protein